MTPQRIQLRRTKGWRLPEGAVVVSRPSKFGNPFLLGPVGRSFPSLTIEQLKVYVVNDFRTLVERGHGVAPRGERLSSPEHERVTYPSHDEIRAELAGRDLACWCKPGEACHADVLLEIANGLDLESP